ncbi:MAG: high frequency lysogenization protein HflD [Gammaproteobacteria bacterium]|nr:high frequency lysogenization protein HflD [Gammaproteobacteria bacterium]
MPGWRGYTLTAATRKTAPSPTSPSDPTNTMPFTRTDRMIALAGLFQAVKLVQQVASSGNIDQQDFETCTHSIFLTDVDRAEDAYGDRAQLRTGFRTLVEQFGGRSESGADDRPKDLHITKYAAGVLVLERRLRKKPDMLKAVADGIERVQGQLAHFPEGHENIVAGLAHVYSETISTLKPRIMVQGEHVYISNPNHANRIRALLLSAIRAAVLWRQCGGTRWQLLFQRKALLEDVRSILSDN